MAKAMGFWDIHGNFKINYDVDTPILRGPMETPWGQIPADVGLKRYGCDVVGLGRVYSPDPNGSTQGEVVVETGNERRSLLVFGDRYWERKDGVLVPSLPDSFCAYDMVWSRSFGGKSMTEEGDDTVYPYNVGGQGYQFCEAVAEGEILPSFEDPNARIKQWDDSPCPCNFAPVPLEIPIALYGRLQEYGDTIRGGGTVTMPPNIGNIAHPNFQFDTVLAGQEITVGGMTPEQPLTVKVPQDSIAMEVQIGKRRHCETMNLGGVLN